MHATSAGGRAERAWVAGEEHSSRHEESDFGVEPFILSLIDLFFQAL
jgi:hypothetical protein